MPTAREQRKVALAKLQVRREQRSNGEDELSDVIDREAIMRTQAPHSTTPPRAKLFFALLDRLSPGGRVVVLVVLIVALVVLVALRAPGVVEALKTTWG